MMLISLFKKSTDGGEIIIRGFAYVNMLHCDPSVLVFDIGVFTDLEQHVQRKSKVRQ